MRKSRWLSAVPLIVPLVFMVGAVASAQIPDSADPAAIPGYRVVRPGLATSGQPSVEALRSLGDRGFKTVVDLRAETEGTAAEREVVQAQGLRYVSIPVTPATFSLRDVEAVAKVLDDPEAAPVLLHCASGNRVGGVWTVLQVRRGKPREEAEEEGRRIGLGHAAMIEAVARVLAELPKN